MVFFFTVHDRRRFPCRLGNLPVEDGGRASLIIKREDRDLAEGVIQAIQAPGSHLPFSTKIGLYQELPRNALFAVMMIVLSILNGGLLSAVMVTIAKYAPNRINRSILSSLRSLLEPLWCCS